MTKNLTEIEENMNDQQKQDEQEGSNSILSDVATAADANTPHIITGTVEAVADKVADGAGCAVETIGCGCSGCSLILFIGLAGLIGTTSLVGYAVNLI